MLLSTLPLVLYRPCLHTHTRTHNSIAHRILQCLLLVIKYTFILALVGGLAIELILDGGSQSKSDFVGGEAESGATHDDASGKPPAIMSGSAGIV